MAFTTIQGSASTDAASLAGTSGVDSAVVTNQPNGLFVSADAANDFLDFSESGSGYTVLGGQGADQIVSGAVLSGASINGNQDADTIIIASLGTSVVYGGKQGDTITTGSLTSSSLYGNLGDDAITVTSGLASSNVYAGKNNDTVTIGGVIAGSTVNGDIGADTINITGANLESGSVVQGGQNEDTITLTGVSVFTNDSSVFGGQGNDTINTSNSTAGVALYGDNDNDTVTSGGGADILDGGNGADNLTAGAGNDTLTGGSGADTMVGDGGNDQFVYTTGLTIDATTFVQADDIAAFSLSALETAGAVFGNTAIDFVVGNGTSAAVGTTQVVQAVAGASTLAVGTTVLNYTVGAGAANAAALETALEAGGGLITTSNPGGGVGGLTAGDSFIIQYNNGAQQRIAIGTVTADVAANTQIAAWEVTDIATQGNIADLAAGNYTYVA